MKKTTLLALLILSTISCKAQNILSIEDVVIYQNSETGIPQNITQIKDINNVLEKFVGTWKGTHNNKNYEFIITKHTRQSSTRNLSEEQLLIHYKITDANNTVIENTVSLLNDSLFVIKGSYYETNGTYILNYQGKDYKCGQNGNIFISVNGNNSTKMRLGLYPHNEILGDCPNGLASQILPTMGGMELTKQ